SISKIILAHNAVHQELEVNRNLRTHVGEMVNNFAALMQYQINVHQFDSEKEAAITSLNSSILAARIYTAYVASTSKGIDSIAKSAAAALPKVNVVGLAVGGDLTSVAESAILSAAAATILAKDNTKIAVDLARGTAELVKDAYYRQRQADFFGPIQRGIEAQAKVTELSMAMEDLRVSGFAINQRFQELQDAFASYQQLVAQGDRILAEREVFRQRTAAVIQGFRTRDAAFRIFRNEKLERYKTLFDLSARYTYLAANAYDYETGLLDTTAGRSFVNRIVSSRALGVVKDGEPQYAGSNTGDPGLSSVLAEMKADWDVLKGRLGFNNPDAYGTTVSLRQENLRILPGADGDTTWQDVLQRGRVENLLTDSDVRRYCLKVDAGDGLPVPGIVLEFSTSINLRENLFGRPLAAGDSAFDESSFATKIYAVGVALEGYRGMNNPLANGSAVNGAGGASPADPPSYFLDPKALAATPYVYLIPVGLDAMRSPPLGDGGAFRTWNVQDVSIPLPFNIGASEFSTKGLYQSSDSLTEPLFGLRKHQAFRPVSSTTAFSADIFGSSGSLSPSQFTNRRLIGRSVWNTQWKLVIPGNRLLEDPKEGLDRFIQTVKDVKLHFVTYSYSGN
ncbi:MAG: hypothetical protein RIS76_927, partial [Verrucomicrobiota bacterium]